YLAAGLPVIASDVPTVRAVLQKWDCGLLFDASQPESLARAMLQIAEDRSLRERLARNALRAAQSELNWEREKPKLIRLVQSLSATTSGSPAR
ncbi:MAG: glycosyltransferase, partial [Chloroflexota bacterium]